MSALSSDGFRFERLQRSHPRKGFRSGQPAVDDWIQTKALQAQEKRLNSTKVLLNSSDAIVGFFSLAISEVDFSELPPDLVKKLPKRSLPVAVLTWLGVSSDQQGQGIGRLLLVQSLRDCFEVLSTIPFIAVILDCIDDVAKAFYQHFDFLELPGQTHRLYLSAARLEAMMTSST